MACSTREMCNGVSQMAAAASRGGGSGHILAHCTFSLDSLPGVARLEFISILPSVMFSFVFVFLHLHCQRWPFSFPDSFLLGQNSVRFQLSVHFFLLRAVMQEAFVCLESKALLCWSIHQHSLSRQFKGLWCLLVFLWLHLWLLWTLILFHMLLGSLHIRGHWAGGACLHSSPWALKITFFTLWPPPMVSHLCLLHLGRMAGRLS